MMKVEEENRNMERKEQMESDGQEGTKTEMARERMSCSYRYKSCNS